MTIRSKRIGPRQGLVIVWPRGVEARYGISPPTRWRWERKLKLPPRDVFIGGVAEGWRPETLDRSDAGPNTTAKIHVTSQKANDATSDQVPAPLSRLADSGNSSMPDKCPTNVAAVCVPLDNPLEADFIDSVRRGM